MRDNQRNNDGILSCVILVAKKPFLLQVLKRITSHISRRKATEVNTIAEAEIEIMKHEPDAVIIDVSDFSSTELEVKLSPFILCLPGWVKTFFVDSRPTASRIDKAREMGVNGVLKAPLSHHGITTLLKSLEEEKRRDK